MPKKHIIPIFVPHLGCPNDCVFCNQRAISGKQQPATADTVRYEIEKALPHIKSGEPCEAAFYGGSFTAIDEAEQNALLSAVQPYIKESRINEIRLSTRPDCITDGCVERLLSYNVKTIELGVQSLDDEVLRLAGRGHTAKDGENAVKIIKKYNVNLILQMMTGLPGDSGDETVKTAEKIISLKPDGVRIYPTVIVKDTRLYDMWKSGRYREHTVEDAVKICSRIVPMFRNAHIPIIRLGLNPTEDLSGGGAAGGAYHPALGQLVRSRIYRNAAENVLLSEYGENMPQSVHFFVPKGEISSFIGQKRCNAEYFREKYGVNRIKVTEDEKLSREMGEISVLAVDFLSETC